MFIRRPDQIQSWQNTGNTNSLFFYFCFPKFQ